MYSKEELLIFSFINSNYDISIQNLTYKIFNFSNKENINFFKLNRIEKIEFLKSFFSENNIEKILNIFVKGNLPSNEELEKSFAIVGTRKPSKEGIDFARDIGQYLSKNNIYNISGLALGIDTVGHNMSLQKTGAILGQGLDLEIYPRENIKLAEMILENNGFLLSELIPQTEISLFSLIKRDRLQSALTSGIIIAETGIKGGTVNTFKYAREQKKKIFISEINKEFIEKYRKDLIIVKNSLDFEKKLKNNLEQKNLF